MADRTVKVSLTADTGQYQSAMKAASQSTTQFDERQQQAVDRSKKWQVVGTASRVAGAAMAAGLLVSARAAGQQAQAFRALDAVFGAASDTMKGYAADAAGIGLSMTDYGRAATVVGSQLKNLGIDQTLLASTTDDLISKSADMAAQFGGSTSEALDAVSAALRKERDPIERYGIALTDTAIKAEMAAQGLNELDATLSLIDKQMRSSGSLGAAARESETLSAKTDELKANLNNLSASIGETLVPVLAQGVDWLGQLAGFFDKLPQPVKNVAAWVGVFGAGLLLVGPKILTLKTQLLALQTQFGATAVSAGTAATGVGKFAATAGKIGSVVAMVAVVGELNRAFMNWYLGDTITDLEMLQQQMTRFARSGVGQIGDFGAGMREFGDAFERYADVAERLQRLPDSDFIRGGPLGVVLTGQATGPILKFIDQLEQMDAALAQLVSSGDTAGAQALFEGLYGAIDQSRYSADQFRSMLPGYTAELEKSALAAENAAAASDADAAAKQRQDDAVRALTNSLRSLLALNLAEMGSKDALLGQERRLTAARKENGAALEGNSRKAVANREAMRNEATLIGALAKATYDRVAALGDTQAAEEAANRVINRRIDKLREAGVAAGFDGKEVRRLARELLGLPKDAVTKAKVDGAEKAQRDLKQQRREAEATSRTDATTKAKADDAKKAAGDLSKQRKAAQDVAGTEARTDASAPDSPKASRLLRLQKQLADVVSATKARTDASAPDSPAARSLLDQQANAATNVTNTPATTAASVPNGPFVAGQLWNIRSAALAVDGTYTVRVNLVGSAVGGAVGRLLGRATGGYISGPGTATSDSIPAMLSDGEYVIRAAAVDRYGTDMLDRINTMRYAKGGAVPKWASRNTPGWVAKLVERLGFERQWWEFNAPRLPGSKQWVGDKWRDKPEQRKGEKDKDYAERVKGWRDERQNIRRQFNETIRREKLDRKWQAREEKRQRRQDRRDAAYDMVVDAERERIENLRALAQQRADDAMRVYESLQADKAAYERTVASAMMSSLALTGAFDFTAGAAAAAELAAAETELSAARRALNEAEDPRQRADALLRLADAQQRVADAGEAARDAEHTPGNILRAMRQRADLAEEYADKVAALESRGLSTAIIDDLATMNPEQGIDMVRAFAAMTAGQIGQVNAEQWRIMAAAGGLGGGLAAGRYDAAIGTAGKAAWDAAVQVNIAAAPVTVQIDGRKVAEALVEYKRRTGDNRVVI